jgi:hypothetical protein
MSAQHKKEVAMRGGKGLALVMILMVGLAVHRVAASLDDGEVEALKDMQAEWGAQLGWRGAPSCSWRGVTCDSGGHVTELYVGR